MPRRSSRTALAVLLAAAAMATAMPPAHADAVDTGARATGTSAASPAAPAVMSRVGGADRHVTAARLSELAFPDGADHVVITSGTNWPDALAAGAGAAQVDAPVLSVLPGALTAPAEAELARLGATRAWVVGGPAAVNEDVVVQLRSRGLDVVRVSGADRYATAAEVARVFFPDSPGAYYASGVTYADALGGGAAAAHRGWPLLLTAPEQLPAATPVVSGERVVLGGATAVSDAVVDALGARRVSGPDRYATAVAVAKDAFAGAHTVYLATGSHYADALAAVPAASRAGAPILLASPSCVTPGTRDTVGALGGRSTVVLGGEAAIGTAAATLTACPVGQPLPPVLPPVAAAGGVFSDGGDGSDLRPYASPALNAVHPLWNVEPGSTGVDRVGGKLTKTGTAQFHRMFSTERFGGPGTTLTISYRARATAIRNRVGSSIIEGAKVGLKWPVSAALSGYSPDDVRSVYGNSSQHDASGPGSYAFLTGITEGGYMEMSRNGYGAEGYTFFPSKRVGYTPGTWKDIVVTVEWLENRSIRTRFWHNAQASGAPVYEATDTNSPFWNEPAFLWLRTDDTDWEYDHITITEN